MLTLILEHKTCLTNPFNSIFSQGLNISLNDYSSFSSLLSTTFNSIKQFYVKESIFKVIAQLLKVMRVSSSNSNEIKILDDHSHPFNQNKAT